MNSMSKKVRLRKEQLAEERRKAEEEKYLASLTEEERVAYLKAQKERGRRAMRLLALPMALAGAYTADTFGVKGRKDGEKNDN